MCPAIRPTAPSLRCRVDRINEAGRGALVATASITTRYLPAPREVDVVLLVNGVERGLRTVEIDPAGVTNVRFDPIAVPPGPVRLVAAMSPDGLPQDDTLHAVLAAEQSHRIMVVTQAGARPG